MVSVFTRFGSLGRAPERRNRQRAGRPAGRWRRRRAGAVGSEIGCSSRDTTRSARRRRSDAILERLAGCIGVRRRRRRDDLGRRRVRLDHRRIRRTGRARGEGPIAECAGRADDREAEHRRDRDQAAAAAAAAGARPPRPAAACGRLRRSRSPRRSRRPEAARRDSGRHPDGVGPDSLVSCAASPRAVGRALGAADTVRPAAAPARIAASAQTLGSGRYALTRCGRYAAGSSPWSADRRLRRDRRRAAR